MLINAVFSEAARSNILLRLIQRRCQFHFTQVMIVFDFHHHKAFFAAHGNNGFRIIGKVLFKTGDTFGF